MGVWTDRVVPRLTDRSLRLPALGELRADASYDVTHLETADVDRTAVSRPWTYGYVLTARPRV